MGDLRGGSAVKRTGCSSRGLNSQHPLLMVSSNCSPSGSSSDLSGIRHDRGVYIHAGKEAVHIKEKSILNRSDVVVQAYNPRLRLRQDDHRLETSLDTTFQISLSNFGSLGQ